MNNVFLFPSYKKVEHSPQIPPDFIGISIMSKYNQVSVRDEHLLGLFGVCQCTKEEANKLEGTILNAVVIVVTFGEYHTPISFSAVKDAILFDSDIIQNSGYVRGYFNIDILDFCPINFIPGNYYISASMQKYLSNIIHVILTDYE